MIITHLFGGIGNQMFQYAAGRSLAKRHDTQLKLDISSFHFYTPRQYKLFPFHIIEDFASIKDRRLIIRPSSSFKNFLNAINLKLTGNTPIFFKKELYFHFDPEVLALPDNIYLDGYYQSEKYFKDSELVIRREFTLKKPLDTVNEKMGKQISSCESVSVHVRRGDYISNPKTNAYHGTCLQEYYCQAIDMIKDRLDNPCFYYFSDDPTWVKENLNAKYPGTIIDFNGPDKDYEDMGLMKLCKYHITANSSFSWWGAWLSENRDKLVIAPKKWFNQPHLDTKDLIPSSWIQI